MLIFAEVLPKSYAIHNADRVALRVGPALRPLVIILAPITAAVQGIVQVTMRLFGVRYGTILDAEQGDQELRGAIDLYAGPELYGTPMDP